MYHYTFLKTKCHVKLLSVGSLQRRWYRGGGKKKQTAASHGIWFTRNCHIVLPEVDTWVLKHVG